MKIELKITSAELVYIGTRMHEFVEENLPLFSTLPKKEKLIVSIALDLADKLAGKVAKANRNPTNKAHKFTFKYHEATAIQSYTVLAKDKETDPYIKHLAHTLYLKVDEKLN